MNDNNRNEITRNGESTGGSQYFTPRVDIFETDGELLLLADMPGVAPGDIELQYENGELVLCGKVAAKESSGNEALSEFETGEFRRVFNVHETIDPTKIEAEHKNGVLTVYLPKEEMAKKKAVPIKVQA